MPEPSYESPLSDHPEVTGAELYAIPATPATKRALVARVKGLLPERAEGQQTVGRFRLGDGQRFVLTFFTPGADPDEAATAFVMAFVPELADAPVEELAAVLVSRANDGETTDTKYTLRGNGGVLDEQQGDIAITGRVLAPIGMKPKYALRQGEGVENRIIMDRIREERAARQDPNSLENLMGSPSEGEVADLVTALSDERLERF